MDTRREKYRLKEHPNDAIRSRVLGPGFASEWMLNEDASDWCLELNAAYRAGVQAERERTSGLVEAGKAMREEIREHMDFIDDRIPFRSERYMNEAAAKWDAAIAPPSTTPNDQTTQPSTT